MNTNTYLFFITLEAETIYEENKYKRPRQRHKVLPKFQMETKDQQRLVTKVLAKKIIHENLQQVKLGQGCVEKSKHIFLKICSQGKQEVGSVRIVFRKDGIAGKGTFGVVQKVKILKITNVDTASNTGNHYMAQKI